jgi:NADH dehydrogenase
MTFATRFCARLQEGEADVTVLDQRSYMTYQPFLAEAASGSVEPRHVVVPLREVVPSCRVVRGEVTGIEHARRTVRVAVGGSGGESRTQEISYDKLVLTPGSVAKTLPIPGLAEQAVGFKTVSEAIYLRNRVISRLDAASSTTDRELRRRLLTFVFVAGGYAGIEGLAELQDMAAYATRYYDDIEPSDMRWMLVEAMGRIMPEVSESLGRYTERELASVGIEVRLDTTIESMTGGHVVLSTSEEFDADTIVWTAGVAASPMLRQTDLPLDDKGRVRCLATLQVEGCLDVFAAGDCAAVPDLSSKQKGATCGPSAQTRYGRRNA